MNGCRKQPPLTYPDISANMQLWAVSRSSTFPPDHHSVFYAIFRVYTNHEKEPSISFRKSAKRFFYRLSERDFRRNPFHKEKAAAEAPPPPSLIGQLSVISQNVSFYRKRQLLQRRSRKQRGLQSKEPSCCYRRSEENRDSQASDRSVFRLPEFQQQPSCTTPPPEIQASQLEQWQSLSIAH